MSFIGVTTILPYGSDLIADETEPFLVIRTIDTILRGNGSGRVNVTYVISDRLEAALEAGHGFMSLQNSRPMLAKQHACVSPHAVLTGWKIPP